MKIKYYLDSNLGSFNPFHGDVFDSLKDAISLGKKLSRGNDVIVYSSDRYKYTLKNNKIIKTKASIAEKLAINMLDNKTPLNRFLLGAADETFKLQEDKERGCWVFEFHDNSVFLGSMSFVQLT